jgi:hypothetical protein
MEESFNFFRESGFDPARGDPVGKMDVTPEGFGVFVSFAKHMADKHCGGKIIMETGGGYSDDSFKASLRGSLVCPPSSLVFLLSPPSLLLCALLSSSSCLLVNFPSSLTRSTVLLPFS